MEYQISKCTLTNRNVGPRVVYDVDRVPHEIQPGKTRKGLRLDGETSRTIRENFRSGADKLELVSSEGMPAKVPPAAREPSELAPQQPGGKAPAAAATATGGAPRPDAGGGKSKGPETAASLLAEAPHLNFFALRSRARTVLGDKWPGQKATREQIEAALGAA